MTVFETRLIRIGTSIGVIIPMSILKQEKLKLGEKVPIYVLNKKKHEAIEKAFGSEPWLKGVKFKRDKSDRLSKYLK